MPIIAPVSNDTFSIICQGCMLPTAKRIIDAMGILTGKKVKR